jgi:pilus assembly protein CpaC
MSLRQRCAAVFIGLFALVTPGSLLLAQAPQPGTVAGTAVEQINITAGRSTVVTTDFDITRIAVTNPAIADAVVVRPREVLVDGKASGTVSLIVWGDATRKHYDVVVDAGVSLLQQNFQDLFRGEDVNVAVTENSVILSGSVSNNDVMLRAAEIARAAFPKSSIVNMLQAARWIAEQPGDVAGAIRGSEPQRLSAGRPEPVCRSRFVRGALDDAAVCGAAIRQRQPQPARIYRLLNLFFFHRGSGIGAVLKALQGRGQLQSLAEPNLIAYNGQEASFLAGGEIPIPVVQGLTGNITIVYKEFGVRLNFTPTIAGDVIRLKLRPEVSSLDYQNGIVISGFPHPGLALSKGRDRRRASRWPVVRDRRTDEQHLAADNQAIPVLSKLPIIGNLFKSRADKAEQTELMVLITPRLVRPLDPDEVPPLPTEPGTFIKPEGEGAEPGKELTDAPEAPKQVPGAVKKPKGKL